MKQMKIAASFMLSAALLIAGCGDAPISQNTYEQALLGKWAYSHDTEQMVAQFEQNGRAVFDNQKYTYTSDGQFIHLDSDSVDDINLRYIQNGDQLYAYIQSTYTRQAIGNQEGIVGVWKCEDTNWTFEFSDQGTFMEDGALTGYYEVNEATSTIKLMYGEALEDTVLYYQLSDDSLFIEYPWLMVKMK